MVQAAEKVKRGQIWRNYLKDNKGIIKSVDGHRVYIETFIGGLHCIPLPIFLDWWEKVRDVL